MSEKVYMVNEGSGVDQSAMLYAMMQNKGVDPNLLAMMKNGNGGQDFIWLLFIFLLFGQNGGGLFGGGSQGLSNQINQDNNTQLLLQAIGGNKDAISALATNLNCSIKQIESSLCALGTQIQSVACDVKATGAAVINEVQAGNAALSSQLAKCCCDLNTSIITQGYEQRLAMQEQSCEIEKQITASATITNAKIDAQTQIINDKFCELEKRELNREITERDRRIAALELSASQQAQTAVISAEIRSACGAEVARAIRNARATE